MGFAFDLVLVCFLGGAMRSMLDLTDIRLSRVKVRVLPKGKVFMNGQTPSSKT